MKIIIYKSPLKSRGISKVMPLNESGVSILGGGIYSLYGYDEDNRRWTITVDEAIVKKLIEISKLEA